MVLSIVYKWESLGVIGSQWEYFTLSRILDISFCIVKKTFTLIFLKPEILRYLDKSKSDCLMKTRLNMLFSPMLPVKAIMIDKLKVKFAKQC